MPGVELPQQEWEVVPPLVQSTPGPPGPEGPQGEKGEPGEPGESVPLVSGIVAPTGEIFHGTGFTVTKGGEGEYIIKINEGIPEPQFTTIFFTPLNHALTPEVIEFAEVEITVVFKTSSVGSGEDTGFFFVATESK